MLSRARIRFLALFLGMISPALVSAQVKLLEPVGGCSSLNPEEGLGLFFKYFNLLWPIFVGTGAGIAVLMTVVGGLQIIMSGGDQSKRQEGIDRFKNALLGLLMLSFAGLILRTLNPSFFTSGGGGIPGAAC